MEIAKSVDWRPHDKQREVVTRRLSGLAQTQLIEDLIGSQKNNTGSMTINRFKIPLTAMTASLSANVIDNRHRFHTVEADTPLAPKTSIGR